MRKTFLKQNSGMLKKTELPGRTEGLSFSCLSESVDIFLKSVERQGESGHDVRVSRFAPWTARVGAPVRFRTAESLFLENSHS